jgi:hypothetical protein
VAYLESTRASEDVAWRAPEPPGVRVGVLRQPQHRRWFIGQVVLWGVVAVILRVAVVPAESCPPVSAPEVRAAIDAGAAWFVRGQRDDGRFLYGYFSDMDEVSADYNNTRHAGVLYALYRARRIGSADAGLRYVRDNLIREDGWTAFDPPGEIPSAGANALLLAALVHRRRATGDERYDLLSRRIGRFLLAQQQADGSVLQYWDPATERSVPGVFGQFSTGEVLYAFALMHRAFPREGWEQPAHRTAEYLATRRDRAEGYALRQPDHWASYGLAELAPAGLTDVEAEYARWLAGYFGFLTRFESQHTDGALNPIVESGSKLGTIGEATAALWQLAGSDPRLSDLRDDLGDRSTCLAGILIDRQVPAGDPNPQARGAWFSDSYTQMDDQQHAVSALLGANEVLR